MAEIYTHFTVTKKQSLQLSTYVYVMVAFMYYICLRATYVVALEAYDETSAYIHVSPSACMSDFL